MLQRPNAANLGDALAGISLAGLLVPEAVAYAGIANLPPQAGLIALFIGLLVYALTGSSRFAVVSSTSSSAAVLAASVANVTGVSAGERLELAAAVVAVTGVLFMIAGLARLGGISGFIARPVLRGFTFGLAATIVIKQLPSILTVKTYHSDMPRYVLDILAGLPHANLYNVGVAAVALVILFGLGERSRAPATLIAIVAGIAASYWIDWAHYGVATVGHIDLNSIQFGLPNLSRAEWTQTAGMGVALMLIVYAESYGSIRSFALKHGDTVEPNRDLFALGLSNLLVGLFHGSPVGAGYSATSANEAAGAQSKLSGICSAVVVALVAWLLMAQLARTPEAVLAAIVIYAVSHSLHPSIFKPYWVWKRDRLIVIGAIVAVLLLGVLQGLLVSIGLSLVLALRKLSEPSVSVLGRWHDSHDFVDIARHPDAQQLPGVLIARPEAQLFFANTERVLTRVQTLTQDDSIHTIVLSLEESPDLDGTTLESLHTSAGLWKKAGKRLVCVRLKPRALEVLQRAADDVLPAEALSELSVDEGVQLFGLASAVVVDPSVSKPSP
jgi:sulfate permease, SulP family